MYERLTGTIVVREPARIVIDVNGIGFAVSIPLTTFDQIPSVGSRYTVLTVLHVKEDDLSLFGFANEDERGWFLKLIKLPGIGPKLAISILSGIRVTDLRQALLQKDVKRLKSISGVGERLAQRLITELQGMASDAAPQAPSTLQPAAATVYSDAVMALEALGVIRATAERSVEKYLDKFPNASVSEVVSKALSNG